MFELVITMHNMERTLRIAQNTPLSELLHALEEHGIDGPETPHVLLED